MTTFNLIDKVSFQGKSFGECTADFLLSPARIALNGRSINISRESVGLANASHDIAIRILSGLVAILLFPITLAALAAKVFFMTSDRPPQYQRLVDENMVAIQMKTFREFPLDSTVSVTLSSNHASGVPHRTLLFETHHTRKRKPSFGSMPIDQAMEAAWQVASHEANFPYSKRKIDFLIERTAKDDPRMHHLSEDGTYANPESILGESGYTRMYMCDTPDIANRWVSAILGKERASNPKDRPSKILLTLGAMAGDWRPSNGINHAIVVVIEPDPMNHDKANITIVNPTGNDQHSEYEDAVIQGVKEIYTDPATRTVKNRKLQQHDADGCGLHAVENIAILKDVPSVQSFVENGKLPDRPPVAVTKVYGEHASCARADYERLRQLSGAEYRDSFNSRTLIAV